MRRFAVLSFTIFAGAVSCASAASAEEIAAPVAACIHANAPKVEKAISSLTEATTFLADNVCAAEVNAEALRQMRLRFQQMADGQKANCVAQQAKQPKPNPQVCDNSGPANSFVTVILEGALSARAVPRKLPEATALAAKTLLDLRLSHAEHKD